MGLYLTAPDLAVLSDSPGVVNEEFTLALVQDGEQVDVQVRVVSTSLRVLNGVVRHRLELELLGAPLAPEETRVWGR